MQTPIVVGDLLFACADNGGTGLRLLRAPGPNARVDHVTVADNGNGIFNPFVGNLLVDAGRFDGHRLRVELLTVPGQWAYAHRRFMLLGSPDAVKNYLQLRLAHKPHEVFAALFLVVVLVRDANRRVFRLTGGNEHAI